MARTIKLNDHSAAEFMEILTAKGISPDEVVSKDGFTSIFFKDIDNAAKSLTLLDKYVAAKAKNLRRRLEHG